MTNYPTNVSNSQWQFISKFLDTQRSRKYDLPEVVNSILYLVKTGCQWRMLPSNFNIMLEIIKSDELHPFKVLPKRWIVERTFA